MKQNNKIRLIGLFGILGTAFLLTGCTQNFCSITDKANIAYPYEQGVTVYCDKDEIPTDYQDVARPVFEGNDTLYAYVPVDSSGNFTSKKSTYLVKTIIAGAKSKNYAIPSQEYFIALDQKVLENAVNCAISAKYEVNGRVITSTSDLKALDVNPFTVNDSDGESNSAADVNYGILREFGYEKFLGKNAKGEDEFWYNWNLWTNELRNSDDPSLGYSNCPTTEFASYYQSTMNSKMDTFRSCVATRDGKYGHYGNESNWEVNIQGKSYSYAWGKGFLEGLIVYPVAWMVDTFAYSMDPALSGVGQIWSIILVTIIVRVILLALTFKGTMDQQKMQALQPELAKIQAKYPNSNTNRSEQSRLQQEQMALYKRNKVSPFSSILTLVIQFPIFISVWSALQGSAVLSSGAFLNLRLSDSIQSALFNVSGTWYLNTSGWWTALVLFIIMAAAQFFAMMLPQWINKRKQKDTPKLSKNPAQNKTASQMKWITYGMLIFTIIMGFFLPAAMGVYWAIGAVISMIQTVLTQYIMGKVKNKKKQERKR